MALENSKNKEVQEVDLAGCPSGTFIEYSDTDSFSKLALDYVRGAASLRPFYAHLPTLEGLEEAMKIKQSFPMANRQVLVENLRGHYDTPRTAQGEEQDINRPVLQPFEKVSANIEALLSENTFTVTTAHQPNIFGGPLYLVYKILHVVVLAERLNEEFKDKGKYFVPFYYMGSEDADLDEIGQFQVNGKKYVWQTDQQGPVGRMRVDKALLGLIDELRGQIGVEAHGDEFIDLLRDCYIQGRQIQEATFSFIHQLFGKYGLLILMPDDRRLKETFEPVVLKELKEGFSHLAVEKTAAAIEQAGYKVQTHGRPINLFYQEGNQRQRILNEGGGFSIEGRPGVKTEDEMIQEVRQRADLFSGNVVLRGPFQETVLPDIAFVGGGGELAYWLEMKGVYEAVDIPYPVLLLRNSFLMMDAKQQAVLQQLGLSPADLFKPLHVILDLLLEGRGQSVDMQEELEELKALYERMQQKAGAVDSTLSVHTAAIYKAAANKAERLVTKMKTAQRKKLDTATDKIQKLKMELFPGGNLQERTENIAAFYSRYGASIIDIIKSSSLSIEQQFGIITLPEPDRSDRPLKAPY